MTPTDFIAAAQAGDTECDITVSELIPSEELWTDPPPFATCPTDHPQRWKLFGEAWEALPLDDGVTWRLEQCGGAREYRITGSDYWDHDPASGSIWYETPSVPTPNLAACVALFLAADER